MSAISFVSRHCNRTSRARSRVMESWHHEVRAIFILLQYWGANGKDAECAITSGAVPQMDDKGRALVGGEFAPPEVDKVLSYLETIHDRLSAARPAENMRSACLRRAWRARNARILTFASLQFIITAISLTLSSSLSLRIRTVRSSGLSESSSR